MRIDPLSVHPRKKGENSRPYAWIVRIVKRMMSLFSLLTAENSNDSHNQFSSVQRTTKKKRRTKKDGVFTLRSMGSVLLLLGKNTFYKLTSTDGGCPGCVCLSATPRTRTRTLTHVQLRRRKKKGGGEEALKLPQPHSFRSVYCVTKSC